MRQALDLSVVIPCHNAERTVASLLQDLSGQTLAKNQYEVIVVDDGSTDNTPALVRGFPFVQLLRQENQGAGQARNSGTARARGEIVLFLDSDLRAVPELLARHLAHHRNNPAVAAVGGSVLPDGDYKILSWQMVDHVCSWFNAHPMAKHRQPIEYLPSLNFSIKKAVVVDRHQVKWRSDSRRTGEDVDYCHQLRQRGLAIDFLPAAVVKHRDRGSCADYSAHMRSWGYHAPFVRGMSPGGLRYGFLFPANPLWLPLTVPAIILGYTFLIWKSWLRVMPGRVTLLLPQIFFGRVVYAGGVIQATLEISHKRDTPSR